MSSKFSICRAAFICFAAPPSAYQVEDLGTLYSSAALRASWGRFEVIMNDAASVGNSCGSVPDLDVHGCMCGMTKIRG